ncbi:MAG: NHLP bacteriocin export ABC transporter permease/ATPase subunit [Acidobacteriota bacterium]
MRKDQRQKLIELGAEVVTLGGNESIQLDQEPYAWVVEGGNVEIFAVPRDPAADKHRTHVATIRTGRILFGVLPRRRIARPEFLRQREEERQTMLLAVGTPETRLLRTPIRGLIELARESENAPEIKLAIEHWLGDLTREAVWTAAPSHFEILDAGQEIELEEGAVGRSARGIVWVRHLDGGSRFLGRPELPMNPAGYLLPISDQTWLVTPAGATVSCVDTEHLVKSGSVWEGLSRFHDLFLDYVDLLVEADRIQEAERLRRRQDLDEQILRGASDKLASVIDGESAPAAAPAAADDRQALDPLLEAARLVTRNQPGLSLRAARGTAQASNHGHALARICGVSRVSHRLVALRDRWWRQDCGPLLAFVQHPEYTSNPRRRLQGHPVALLPTSVRSYELLDPKTGERKAVDEVVANGLEAEAFMFYPSLPERAVELFDLVRLATHGQRRDVVVMLAMGAATGLLALLVPILTGHIFGNVIPAADERSLFQMSLALAAAALAAFGFRLTRSIALLRISGKLDGSLQAAVWDRLLALPVTFYRRYTTGDLVQRSMGVDQIRNLLLGNVATSFLDAIFSVFSLALIFYYSWRLGVVALGMVLLLLLVTSLLVWLQIRSHRIVLHLQGKLASLVFGLLAGIRKLRGSGAEPRAFALWAGRFSEMRRQVLKVRRLANLQAAFNITHSVLTLMALFAAMFFWSGIELSVSQFLAFAAAFGQFQAASLVSISLLSSILTMVPIYERLRPILDEEPESDEDKLVVGRLAGDLEFSQVSFRYDPQGPLILNEVSIRARPGELVALVGPSGSGKSTTLRLILGFETPDAGSIYFDGQDQQSLDSRSLRRHLGVVLQNGKPMGGDIFRNIVGNSNLGIKEAWEAAAMAGLAEDIKELPMGMHSLVSEGGGAFSGGQIQRLMIARAIVHRPRILLFDEATSALDNRTQDLVSRSLENLKATRIVVAHRLSTIRNADRIYVMDKGRVVETGTYEGLMNSGGTFSELARRQIA